MRLEALPHQLSSRIPMMAPRFNTWGGKASRVEPSPTPHAKTRTTNRLHRAALHGRTTGFSLMETALALGVLTLMLAGLMSVMPIALDSTAQASRVAAVSLITKSLQSRGLSELAGHDLYFDPNGTPCAKGDPQAAYWVTVRSYPSLPLPGDVTGTLPVALLHLHALRDAWAETRALRLPP